MSEANRFLHRLSTWRALIAPQIGRLWQYELKLKGVEGWRTVSLNGRPHVGVYPGSVIRIGAGSVINSAFASNPLGCLNPTILHTLDQKAVLSIGAGCGLSACVIACAQSLAIGENSLLGVGAMIMDTDFHHLEETGVWSGDPVPSARPVSIGRDVFIGARCIILKGTTIGDHCIIGAGAVVKGSFPPWSLIAGNPGRVVRNLPSL